MKRFTDCNKWDDPWYCELSPENRSFYEYILDRSDQVGMWKLNKRMAEFCIQAKIDTDEFLKIAGKRIHVYNSESWWIVGYCNFQYGDLKDSCKPHLKYIKMLKNYGLFKRVSKGYTKGINTLEDKDKDKEEDKDKDKEEISNLIKHLNLKTGSNFRPSSKTHSDLIAARINDGYSLDDIKNVIDFKSREWKNDPKMKKFLRPVTLFNKTKFDTYYGLIPKIEDDPRNATLEEWEKNVDPYQDPFATGEL